MEAIIIRAATSDDYPFILNSWLNSFYDCSNFTKNIDRKIFNKYHHQVAENILNRITSIKLIAANNESPDIIYGYAIYEKILQHEIFHYIYVKRPFKNFGITRKLLEASPFPLQKGVVASHFTSPGRQIIDRFKLTYIPYLI